MSNDSFYVTLPSNSSMNYFHSNVLSNYTTKLSEPLQLLGDWECCMVEGMWPNTVFNIFNDVKVNIEVYAGHPTDKSKGENHFHSKSVLFKAGYYKNLKELLIQLNLALVKANQTFKDPVSMPPRFLLASDGHILIQTFYERNAEGYVNIFYPNFLRNNTDNIFEMLGFKPIEVKKLCKKVDASKDTVRADNPPNLHGQANFINWNCDIISPQLVGDMRAQVMLTTGIQDSRPGEISVERINPPRYLPVCKNHIETINIVLTNEYGDQIKFDDGRVQVVLHFRRQS